MRKLFTLILLSFSFHSLLAANDSLVVQMNKTRFQRGDTIDLQAIIPNFEQSALKAATLHIWADHIESGTRWKFRYPFINGVAQGNIIIGQQIPDGNYAFNFLVQKGYFRLGGQLTNYNGQQKINMMMILKNKAPFSDEVELNNEGRFRLKSTLFEDAAYFVFTPTDRKQKNDLNIQLEAQIDSSFVPAVEDRVWVKVGKAANSMTSSDSIGYSFNMDKEDGLLLPGVTVTSKFKKKVEQYEAQYSSQAFKRDDAMVFDGLEDETIAKSMSVLRFLESKVPGLVVEKDQETNIEVARWRGEPVMIFIDEFQVNTTDVWVIPPSDIAMIKVYRPPANLSILAGSAGAIAIYSKRGEFANNRKAKHSFTVKGYTPAESTWQ